MADDPVSKPPRSRKKPAPETTLITTVAAASSIGRATKAAKSEDHGHSGDHLSQVWREIGKLQAQNAHRDGEYEALEARVEGLEGKVDAFADETRASLKPLSRVVGFVDREEARRDAEAKERELARAEQRVRDERITRVLYGSLPLQGAVLTLLVGSVWQRLGGLPTRWYLTMIIAGMVLAGCAYLYVLFRSSSSDSLFKK